VQRHHAVLGEAEDAAGVENGDEAVVDADGENASVDVGGEVERAGKQVEHYHRGENEALGGGGEVNEVFAGAFVAFVVLMVGYQRVSDDADDLVEKIEREEIVGERAADGAEEREGETGVEARLLMLMETAHVAGGVKDGQHPEER